MTKMFVNLECPVCGSDNMLEVQSGMCIYTPVSSIAIENEMLELAYKFSSIKTIAGETSEFSYICADCGHTYRAWASETLQQSDINGITI